MTTASQTYQRINLPEEIYLGSFTLTICDLEEQEAEDLSRRFRRLVVKEFAKLEPVVALFYDLDIEEGQPWRGSRKSPNRAKLKKKKGGSWLDTVKRIGGGVMLALNLLAIDPDIVKKNLDTAIHTVEEVLKSEGHKVSTEDKVFHDFDLYVLPSSRPRKRDGSEP